MRSFFAFIILLFIGATKSQDLTPVEEPKDYVVVWHDDIPLTERNNHLSMLTKRGYGANIKGHFSIGESFHGFHGGFDPEGLNEIRNSPAVAIVEPDAVDSAAQDVLFTQTESPWGLSRISHQKNTLHSSDDGEYIFMSGGGKDTTIYILDTGVRTTHVEFTDRIRWGNNFVDNVNSDENGHGTHVAGIAAGYSVGVSKFAEIVPVKILNADQTGSLSNFLKAMSWIIEDYKEVISKNKSAHGIINYSAVGEPLEARNKAISAAIEAGIFFVGASGNKEEDACKYGPPNSGPNRKGQLIVAALNSTDEPASFTNYGPCVDVYAPGVEIKSSLSDSDTDYGLMSGTSMATPHVAGLVSYYWSLNTSYTMEDIAGLIKNSNTGSVVNNLPDTVNNIAFNMANITQE